MSSPCNPLLCELLWCICLSDVSKLSRATKKPKQTKKTPQLVCFPRSELSTLVPSRFEISRDLKKKTHLLSPPSLNPPLWFKQIYQPRSIWDYSVHSFSLSHREEKMHFWSFLHSVCNEGRIIHSPGWFGHIPSVIFPVWPIAVVWPGGNPLIAVLLSWLPLQHYSELPSIGNTCSTGCVNAL